MIFSVKMMCHVWTFVVNTLSIEKTFTNHCLSFTSFTLISDILQQWMGSFVKIQETKQSALKEFVNFLLQVVSPANGLQREASLDVEDEFHRAPESSNELETTSEPHANAGEPGILESSSHADVFPRPEEIACTTGEGKEAEEVEERGEASLLAISQESGAVDKSEKNNDVYQGMESEEDRENRQAMEAWGAQRGVQEVGFRCVRLLMFDYM